MLSEFLLSVVANIFNIANSFQIQSNIRSESNSKNRSKEGEIFSRIIKLIPLHIIL